MLWAGTRQGLARYDESQEKWIPVGFNSQLPCPNITALAFQNGTLWVGTPHGMGRYVIAEESWSSIPNISYNIRDIFFDTTGKLWLATLVQHPC